MNKKDFRKAKEDDINVGSAVWLEGRFDVNMRTRRDFEDAKGCAVTGPYLVERVLFRSSGQWRIDVLDPGTGGFKSLMVGWLLVPKAYAL